MGRLEYVCNRYEFLLLNVVMIVSWYDSPNNNSDVLSRRRRSLRPRGGLSDLKIKLYALMTIDWWLNDDYPLLSIPTGSGWGVLRTVVFCAMSVTVVAWIIINGGLYLHIAYSTTTTMVNKRRMILSASCPHPLREETCLPFVCFLPGTEW